MIMDMSRSGDPDIDESLQADAPHGAWFGWGELGNGLAASYRDFVGKSWKTMENHGESSIDGGVYIV